MIAGKSVLALIPARGGSKGLPRKNVLPLGGRPLIGWTIAAAQASRYVDRIVLSSDDPEIVAVARALGCEAPFVRPARLASDEARSIDVALHALGALDTRYDYLVLLQPTSPLRTAADIDACLERCARSGATSCVSVVEVHQHPAWMFHLGSDDRLQRYASGEMALRRQDLPPIYVLNGAVYVANSAWLAEHRAFLGEETLGYAMPESRSMDIDTRFDLQVAEMMLEESRNGTA